MNGEERQRLERALRAQYRSERPQANEGARSAAMAAVRAEAARWDQAAARTARRGSGAPAAREDGNAAAWGFAAFVASQVRFVHPWVWAAQIALVAIMVALCWTGGTTSAGLALATSLLGALTVLVGLPDLFASKTQGVAELEYACRFDCRAVAAARLIILGCSDAVVVACIALASPLALGADALGSLLYACVPYFLACAGSLLAARRCAASAVLPLSCAWAVLVMAASYAASLLVPDAYASASVGMWALACAVSAVWAVREVRAWLACIAAGLNHLAPDPSL